MDKTLPAGADPVHQTVRPISGMELLRWLYDNLAFDGFGYWLPDACVLERGSVLDPIPKKPTFEEFRTLLSAKVRDA